MAHDDDHHHHHDGDVHDHDRGLAFDLSTMMARRRMTPSSAPLSARSPTASRWR
jgi:hypothetical protein